jgi:hypothetical protein
MVAKKEIRDSRLTFTINPEIEKRVREKVEAEKRTISGVIVSLLEKWLSGEPIHTDVTDMNHSLPLPPPVDIEQLKKDILEELKKEISTGKKEEPVQSALVHTDMNQCESITEAPTSPDNDVTHIEVSPKEETSIPKRYEKGEPGYITQLIGDFRVWMKDNGLNEKSFKKIYGFDVSKLKQWGESDKMPKGKDTMIEKVLSGETTPTTDSH